MKTNIETLLATDETVADIMQFEAADSDPVVGEAHNTIDHEDALGAIALRKLVKTAA